MTIDQNFIINSIKNAINDKLSNVGSNLDISTLEDSILDDLNEQLSINTTVAPETLIAQFVNENPQIQQILASDSQLKSNPSDSQNLTPNKVFTQPNFQFGVNISLEDLSTAIRKLLVEEFNNQFNTDHLYSDFSFTTVPAKESFQCAYLLNKDNINLRVDVNTFYGSSFTKINTFTLNAVAGNNTDIIYTSTGIMGNDIYKLGNLEFKKYCQVLTTDPTIYQDTFIPIVLFDNVPYVKTNFSNDYMFTISQNSYDLITSNPIKRPSFYLDSTNQININIVDPTQLINSVSTYSSGEISATANPIVLSNPSSSKILNICNTKLIAAQSAGFEVFDYITGNSVALSPIGYSYLTQLSGSVFSPDSVSFGGVVTDTDGTCLPIYFYNNTLFNTNVSSNTTYQYTLKDLNNVNISGNIIPVTPTEFNAITVPNLIATGTTATNYDKICNSSSYSSVKDFTVMAQVNSPNTLTQLGTFLNISLLVTNAKDAYLNNINLNITDVLNTYFAKYVAQSALNFTMPVFMLDEILPVVTSIDQNGYAKLAILVYLTSNTGYYVQGIIILTNNFEVQDFFILEKIYNSNTNPLNYRQSNYVLQPVTIAGTCTNILMAIEDSTTITIDNFLNKTEDNQFYHSLVFETGRLQLVSITNKDSLPLKVTYRRTFENIEGIINYTYISKLMNSNNDEPISSYIRAV